MEIQSANSLQDTIHNLYTRAKMHDAGEKVSMASLLSLGSDLVTLFNDHEISSPGGKLSSADYQLFLIAHLIVLDTVNARFLWKRIPKSIKEEASAAPSGTAPSPNAQTLNEIWGVTQALCSKNYPLAFSLIQTLIKQQSQDSEKNGSTLKLLEVL